MSHTEREAVDVADRDSPAADTTPDEAQQTRAACASVLEAVAIALADLAVSTRAVAAQMRGQPAAGHTCVMPRGAAVLTIYRCPACGKEWRLYPPEPASGNAASQWREI